MVANHQGGKYQGGLISRLTCLTGSGAQRPSGHGVIVCSFLTVAISPAYDGGAGSSG